jgi:hypothetical protein
MAYHDSVFINCPFDDEFLPLRNAIVFAIFDCGFLPRCVLESVNGQDNRLEKIKKLIRECRLGIHDISRTDLDLVNGLPRFNMPLELGVFIGAATYGRGRVRDKSLLVLDREPYRYQKFMSDISGQDIFAHRNSIREVIKCVRNWLASESIGKTLPGAAHVVERFKAFSGELPSLCAMAKMGLDELTYPDYANLVSIWADDRRSI